MSQYIKMLEQAEDTLTSLVSADSLMHCTAAISKWERVSGTKDEVESLEYIADLLEKMGYKVRLTFHPAYISVPQSAAVSLLLPERISVNALGHSFAPTGTAQGPLVLPAGEVGGSVVLCDGLLNPAQVKELERRGAAGVIYRQDNHLHNAPASALWSAPTESTEEFVIHIPVASVTRNDGDLLESYIKKSAQVLIETRVDTGWRDIPMLEADLPAEETDNYALFGGHIDSWYFGAMDNAAANATMIECAGLLASRRELWRRGLKLAFWAGHSQGRYAGSAWYADHHFEELQERCVGYVYADSTGGMDSEIIAEAPVMPQTLKLAADVVGKQTGEQFVGRRIGRYADQSFFGVGIPSIFGTFSEQDAEKTAGVLSFQTAGANRAGGLGWWWHTTEDTMDKVSPEKLLRDTKIYLAVTWRMLTQPVLPYDVRSATSELLDEVSALSAKLGGAFGMSALTDRVAQLDTIAAEIMDEASQADEPGIADRVNRRMLTLSRHVIPMLFHPGDRFDFAAAACPYPVPALYDGVRMLKEREGSDRYYQLMTQFVRGVNRLSAQCAAAIEACSK